MKNYIFNGTNLELSTVYALAKNSESVIALSEKVREKVNQSRALLDRLVKENRTIYGVNTSLGGLVDYLVPESMAAELQINLIKAVASNVGPFFSITEVRAAMLARINSLARGCSAISAANLDVLVQMFNKGVIPCVPKKGSLGASGDLGPLAAIALCANGLWKSYYKGEITASDLALKKAGIQPMKMDYKEGLSLINGTSMMVGMASLITEEAGRLFDLYDYISVLSFEVLSAKSKPFHPAVHREKPHKGQQDCASKIFEAIQDSGLSESEEDVSADIARRRGDGLEKLDIQIEDPYSIRCTPQILGPVKETFLFTKSIFENELNSSNDNPLVIPGEDDVFHNGHFHGQYMSMGMDYLRIAITTLCNLSDRRIDRLLDKNKNKILPPFLCRENPGLRLGLMGGQFCSTSLTAENRALCTPLSIQTLPSTGEFQDIVSMGLISARNTREVLDNAAYIAAFELICALQAADIRGPEKLGNTSKIIYNFCRGYVPYLDRDEILTEYIENIAGLILNGEINKQLIAIQK